MLSNQIPVKISVVVPLYNEEENIDALFGRLLAVLDTVDTYEALIDISFLVGKPEVRAESLWCPCPIMTPDGGTLCYMDAMACASKG